MWRYTNTHLFLLDGTTGETRREASCIRDMLPGGRLAFSINSSGATVWDVLSGERLLALESGIELVHLNLRRPSLGGNVVAACGRRIVEGQRHQELVVWDALSSRVLLRAHHAVGRDAGCATAVAPWSSMADVLD